MNKTEFKKAYSDARMQLRNARRQGYQFYGKAVDALPSVIYRVIMAFQMPVSVKVCLYLCEKNNRKTDEFV